jgi:hypothetical protein
MADDRSPSPAVPDPTKVCPNIPQDTESIQQICLDAQRTKNAPDAAPADALSVDVVIHPNDPSLWETIHDGGCLVYTLFYAIYRNSWLRSLFHSKVRRNADAYFYYIRVSGDMYTVSIPISVIAEEKATTRAHIFSSDLEFLNGLTILCFVVMYLKYGFIDRLALQPFIETDMFFDNPFFYLGTGATVHAYSPTEFRLQTDLRVVSLLEDGRVGSDDGCSSGHFIFTFAYYAEGCNFGHCVVVFWDCDEGIWKYYNNLNHEGVDKIGEFPLSAVVPLSFNGLVIQSGVATVET